MPFDWAGIRLVVFDVDGTLYRQGGLRLTMLRLLAADAVRSRSLRTMRLLAAYRREREVLADALTTDFEAKLVAGVAKHTGTAAAEVEVLVADWIETRPLSHLKPHIVPGTAALFDAVRRSGRTLGILSDYPATAKLAALGLAADHVVSAADAGIMKPSPAGLIAVIARAGATPATTVLVGDRVERDGAAARAAGVSALIRSSKPVPGWQTFADFTDPLFAPLLAA